LAREEFYISRHSWVKRLASHAQIIDFVVTLKAQKNAPSDGHLTNTDVLNCRALWEHVKH
jgi:hypothetical protein